MDADTKRLIKELNAKIHDEKTDIEIQKECINIMINMIENYDLTDKLCRICSNCSRLKHISLFPVNGCYHNDICRLCHLNIYGDVAVYKFKCVYCNIFLTESFSLKQHKNTSKHKRAVMKKDYLV